jgi:hypothetical protein
MFNLLQGLLKRRVRQQQPLPLQQWLPEPASIAQAGAL